MTDGSQLSLGFMTGAERQEHFKERAAIAEYDGAMPREEAEGLAEEETRAAEAKLRKKYPLDAEGYLRLLVARKEYMVYLYGQNPHMCFVRSHASDDDGIDYPIMRKDALKIMGGKYAHNCNHIRGDRRAKVFLRNG